MTAQVFGKWTARCIGASSLVSAAGACVLVIFDTCRYQKIHGRGVVAFFAGGYAFLILTTCSWTNDGKTFIWFLFSGFRWPRDDSEENLAGLLKPFVVLMGVPAVLVITWYDAYLAEWLSLMAIVGAALALACDATFLAAPRVIPRSPEDDERAANFA